MAVSTRSFRQFGKIFQNQENLILDQFANFGDQDAAFRAGLNFQIREDRVSTRPGLDRPVTAGDSPIFRVIPDDGGIMVATTLTAAGQVAIIGVSTEDIIPGGAVENDTITFILLSAIGSGTVIYFTDRNWNGSAFAAAGGGDGTFTFTAVSDMAAGSVVTITQAQLSGLMDLSDAGETIYAYQGAINAPTLFLHAVDIADGTNGFEGTELTGTGLVNGTSAVAINEDNAEFGTRTHNIQIPTLFSQINNNPDWVRNDNSPQDGTVTGTPAFTAPDRQIWVAGSGAGEAIVTINLDGTYGSGTLGYQIVQAFQNEAQLFHPSDITLDTVHDKYFFVDADLNGNNRIIQGSISQLLNNPGQPPIFTVLYSNAGTGAVNSMRTLSIDMANQRIYFDVEQTFVRINYDTAAQTPTVLRDLEPVFGAASYITQMTINYTTGTVFLGSSSVTSVFSSDFVDSNRIFMATGLTGSNPANSLTFTEVNWGANGDTSIGGEGAPLGNNHWPVERGTIRGVDVNPATGLLYIVTGTVILDNDANGLTTYFGGVWTYNPSNGAVANLFTQNGSTGPVGILYYIEVDPVTGRYYVIDATGGSGNGDGGVWSGSLTGSGTPTFVATVGNFNGLGPHGLEIQAAPTLTGTALTPTITETAGNPSANPTPVTVANNFQSTDADSGGLANGDELAGAQVRISGNFQSGAGHADQLLISTFTTGTNQNGTIVYGADTITFSYNAATGVMTFTGITTLDNYENALARIQYRVDGDNPTNYGTAGSRIVSFSTFDGLLYSDEVHATVTVTGINDAPINVVPLTQVFNEDVARVFSSANGNALSVSDVDADPATQALRVTLTVGQGTLTLATISGLSFVGGVGDGTADATMTFTGTANAINTALNGLTYNPIADYNGSDTLTFTVNDQGFNGTDAGLSGTGSSEQDSKTVTLTINAVVDIVADTIPLAEDAGATNLNLLGNDNFENAGRFISAVGTASHGTVTINDNGTPGILTDDFVVYTAVADYNGSDTFTYTVTSGGVTETIGVTVNISAVTDIVADIVPLAEDAGATQLNLLGNDNFENLGRSITAVTQGAHGFVAINDNNTVGDTTDDYVVYTAVSDYNGSDTFNYTVTSGGVTETIGVTVNISAVVDIQADSITVAEDSGANHLNGIGNPVSLIANDSFENAGRFISATTNGAHGTATIFNNGTAGDTTDDYVIYTVTDLNYVGSDTFTYTVTSGGVTEMASVSVNITAVNDAPINTVPGTQTINEDGSVTFAGTISIADVDAGAADLTTTVSIADGALTVGTVLAGLAVTGEGTNLLTLTGTIAEINDALNGLTYTPPAHANGSRTLTVTTNDNGNTGTPGALQDVDPITINITAINDTPVVALVPSASSTEQVAGAIDATATITDIELGALDNYAGSTLNVARMGGAVAQDVLGFGASGAFTVNGANLEAPGGLVFATFAGGNGTALLITFTGSGTPATQALVNAVVQSLQYTNTSDTPPASIQLVYTFNDGAPGNAGQGPGGSPTGTDTITINITDTPENAPPTLDLDADNSNTAGTGYTAAFTEGGAAVLITDTDVAIADVDAGDMIEGATIAINSAVAGDQLVLGAQVGFIITGSGTATITIAGTGTAAQYQDMLELITFSSSSEDPGAIRTINVTVTDGTANSNIAVSTINITQINDEPTLTATGVSPTFTEGGAAADLFNGVTASTIEAGQSFTSLTLTVGSVTDGADEILNIDGSAVALTNLNNVVTTHGTVSVTVLLGTATVTFTSAGVTPAELQTLIDNLTYSNTSQNPTDADRVVTLTRVTDSGSSTSPNDNETTLAIVSTVNVNPLNDAPVNGVPTAQTINEDASVTFSSGGGNAITVSDVDIGAGNFTVTLSILDGSLVPVSGGGAVIGNSGTNNVTITGTLAQVNAALEGLVYTPPAHANGVRTLTVTTSDNGNSGGAAEQDIDTVTINITPLNDAPVVPNSPTVTTDEQTAVTINPTITVSDIDLDARNGGAGDYSGAAFAINRAVSNAEDIFSFNTTGALFTVNGNNLEVGGIVIATLAQSAGILNINFVNNGTVPTTALVNDVLRHLQYTNTSDTPPASVTLLYILDDGAPGGGQGAVVGFNNIDGGQVTINITATNDAPLTTAPASASGNEDTAIAISGITVSDIDVGGGTLTVTLSIADGALNLVSTAGLTATGVGTNSVSLTGTAADLNASLAGLTYTPPLHANGIRALTVGTSDNGNTGTPGAQTDTDMVTITINSVNDAPSGANNTVTGSEDDPYVFTATDFGFSDPADGNAFLAVIIDSFPANGTLFLDSDGPGGAAPVDLSTLGPGVFVSVTDINQGDLYFQPDPDEFGNGYATFTFRVQDDGGMLNGGVDRDPVANTITINIAPDNLPPVVDLDGVAAGVNYTTTFVEDGAAVAIGSGVAVSDPDVGLGDMIESATITLTDRVAGDSLTITGALPPGIIAVTTPTAGAITIQITGAGTGAQYQALIESILYATTSQDPTVGGTDPARTITVTVNDGAINSAVATTTVNITASDDAPVAQPDAFTITESGTIVGGNLFANNGSGADSDPDGPPLTISAVTGGPGANVGAQFTLDSGALLTVHANGTFDYNPNGVFLPTPTLGSGASNTPSHDSFTYTLAGGNTVTVSITLTGLDTNDLLLGTAGDDIMMAGLGTDELIGGLGDDQLYGEGGNDSLTGGANDDLIDGGTGIDTAHFSSGVNYLDTLAGWVITSLDGTDFVQNTEVVIDGGGQRNLLVRGTGYATLQAALTGAATGDNVRLATGTYTGTVNYSVAGLTVIAQSGAAQNLTYATLSAFGITVFGAGSADTITGSANNDALNGGGGADVLNGAGGNDYLDGGGTGVAQLIGGSGDDTMVVDADDLVTEAVGGGFDNVAAKVSYLLNAGAEVEVLSTTDNAGTAAINLGGNAFGQVLVGNAGNNYLDGGGGADLLAGLGGNDTYIVDADDRVSEGVGGGHDNVAAKVSYVLEVGQEIEVLSTTDNGGAAAIDLTGNEFGQVLLGNAGANVLDGGRGNDLLVGLGGADTFAFTSAVMAGNVDTILDFTSGSDIIALDDAAFTGLTPGALPAGAFVTGTAALDADDRIIYDSATGALYFDADGNGAGAQVQFATVSGLPVLTAADFIVI